MGDRANFGFTQSNGDTIIVYGHWAGSGMLDLLARAVDKARSRWSDESYATRIAISNLIQDEWTSETGWGMLVNQRGDNEHKIPIVNFDLGTFSLHGEATFSDSNKIKGVVDEPLFVSTLDSFVSKYAKELILVD
jgi:hypothetical protein